MNEWLTNQLTDWFGCCIVLRGMVQVYALLDEYILAGEVQETNKELIINRLKDIEKLEWDDIPWIQNDMKVNK